MLQQLNETKVKQFQRQGRAMKGISVISATGLRINLGMQRLIA